MKNHADLLERLAKGIAALLGHNCEIAVHDLSKGFESDIIAIENGHVTDRRVGDGASGGVLKALADGESPQDRYGYMARTKDGRVVKATSVYVRDENDKVIGLFSVNYDVTDIVMARHAIDGMLNMEDPADGKDITVATNVNDLLDQLIADADAFIGKPVAVMTKEDKTAAIQYLNGKGAFLVKKAGDKVARHYDISKYTLYNYMDSNS